MPNKRVLFVDDEPNVLDGLQRMLRRQRGEWEMTFVTGGQEALNHLKAHETDVIVSDIRMPEMDGVTLLTRVREQYPGIVRIALSGFSDQEMLLRSTGPVHQFLAKPCDADALRDTVVRACALRELLAGANVQSIVSSIRSLPAMPALYQKVVEVLASPEGSVGEVGLLISRDVGMTAKVLQLVNSAFFGLRHHVTSAEQAVALLGMDTVKALVIGLGTFSDFEKNGPSDLPIERISYHSTRVANVGHRIAQGQGGGGTLVDDALMAGMLHAVGVLVFLANFRQEYREVRKLMAAEPVSLIAAESQVFGVSHAEVGAYLLGIWGLPDAIVEAVAFHNTPLRCVNQAFSAMTATHVANALVHEREVKMELRTVGNPAQQAQVDETYIEQLQLTSHLPKWREICASIVAEKAAD